MIDKDVLGVAHQANAEYVKYIWWYSILEDRFEGYSLSEVDKHASTKFKLYDTGFKKCARGRVVLFKDKYYLLIWTPGYNVYTNDIIERIVGKVSQVFTVDYVIDESGQELK